MSAPTILPSGVFTPPDAAPMQTASTFSDIQVEAKGAFCQVLRARRQGQWWCLKCLKEEYRGQTFYEGLLHKEYALLCRLSHSSVVRATGLEQVDGVGECIVQEYVAGQTLDKVMGSRTDRRRWYEQLVEAVSYIHSQQVVHRDLKPQNVIVTDNGRNVKLIDFGLADADNYCELKQAAGTLRYVSPEQQEGSAADVRNDIYSLGVILRELQLGVIYRPIVRRCLRPIDSRYQNIGELLQALRRISRVTQTLIVSSLLVVCLAVVNGVWESKRSSRDADITPSVIESSPQEEPQEPYIEEKPLESATDATTQREMSRRITPDDVYSECCAKIDAYMQSRQYSQLLAAAKRDPQDSPEASAARCRDYAEKSNQFLVDFWAYLDALSKGYAQHMSSTQVSTLYLSLTNYSRDKYINSLTATLQQYVNSEQEYHRTLPAD